MEEAYDYYIAMQVMLPVDYVYGKAKVVGWIIDTFGNPVEAMNKNHLLESIFYHVEFNYRTIRKFVGNIIAYNMYAQVDE